MSFLELLLYCGEAEDFWREKIAPGETEEEDKRFGEHCENSSKEHYDLWWRGVLKSQDVRTWVCIMMYVSCGGLFLLHPLQLVLLEHPKSTAP